MSDSIFKLGDLTVTSSEDGVQLSLAGAQAVQLDARDAAQLAQYLLQTRGGESRTGFRVPLRMLEARQLDLHATLVHRATIYDLEVVDISLTGVLVQARGLDIEPRSRVVVRVILDDLLSKAVAEVVRSDAGLLALHFSESIRGGELQPPAQLEAIVKRLEQLYLRARSRG